MANRSDAESTTEAPSSFETDDRLSPNDILIDDDDDDNDVRGPSERLDVTPTQSLNPRGSGLRDGENSPEVTDSYRGVSRVDPVVVPAACMMTPVDLESDLVLSSDSDDDLVGSELNLATTTTEDEDLRNFPRPELIELRVLNRRGAPKGRAFCSGRQQDRRPKDGGARKRGGAFLDSEIEIDEDHPVPCQSSDHLSEQSSRVRRSGLLGQCQTGTTTLETTVDTEDDHDASITKRPVKTRKKKTRQPSTSETDTLECAPHSANHQRAHPARRSTRRAYDAQGRGCASPEARIIFAPFPLAIISDSCVGNDASALSRLVIAANDVSVENDDEGDVDDDHGNEKEDDEDEDIADDDSVASTCISGAATHQSRSDSSLGVPTCRICFQPEEEGSLPYRLVSPCLCEGTVKYLHQICVNRWIAESGTPSCELCGYRFHLKTLSIRNLFHWRPIRLNHWDRVHLSLGLFSLLFVVVSLCYMLWATFSTDPSAVFTRNAVASEVLFPIYACLDALTLCVCSYELTGTAKRLWRRLRAVNSCLVVMNKPTKPHMRRAAAAADSAVLYSFDAANDDALLDDDDANENRDDRVEDDIFLEENRDRVLVNEDVHLAIDANTRIGEIGRNSQTGGFGGRTELNESLLGLDDRSASVQLSLTSYDPLTSCSTSILIDDVDAIYGHNMNDDEPLRDLESMV